MKIGLCGTRNMGAATGARLLEMRHELVARSRDAAKAAPLVAAGATLAGGNATKAPGLAP